jgi:hypothetical protein
MNTGQAIQQFTDAFKIRLRDRLTVDSWKIASIVKDGVVQLATTDRYRIISLFSCSRYSRI